MLSNRSLVLSLFALACAALLLGGLSLAVSAAAHPLPAAIEPPLTPSNRPAGREMPTLAMPAQTIAVSGTRAYAGFGPRLVVLDISDRANPQPLDSLYLEVDAIQDVEPAGDLVYVAGNEGGLRVVQASPEGELTELGATTEITPVYRLALVGDYAYGAARDDLGVFALADPAHPALIGRYDGPTGWGYDVDAQGDYAYFTQAGLKVLSVATPSNPVEIGFLSSFMPWGVDVEGEYAYLADHLEGLKVISVTLPSSPTLMGVKQPGTYATQLVVSGTHVYMCGPHYSYSGGYLHVFSVEDPTTPTLLGSLFFQAGCTNLDVIESYVYIANGNGVHVISVADPGHPIEVGSFTLEPAYARANILWDSVDGSFGPGDTVWYTVTDSFGEVKGGGQGTAEPGGWLGRVWCDCDLVPGDQVHVLSDAAFDAVLVPITITGQIDVDADTVSGQMVGGVFPAGGALWVWSNARQQGHWAALSIDAGGAFAVDLGGQFDLWVGDTAEVWYYDPNANELGTEFRTLSIEANYGHDWLWAGAPPDTLVTFEVVGKATLQAETDRRGDLYSSWADDQWLPGKPDIQPGDTVSVTAAGYQAMFDPVGAIEGEVDLKANTVVGTLDAPWLDPPVHVVCEIWEGVWPSIHYWDVDPDGGTFLCDWEAVGWDLHPGQTLALRYWEPDGDVVINAFSSGFGVYLPLLVKH